MSSVTVGLISITRWKENIIEPHLITMHSWMGVTAVTFFGINFLIGLIAQLVKMITPNLIKAELNDIKMKVHRIVGCVALGCTVIAIITGIMNHLDQSTLICENMPFGCQIGNSLGIFVVCTGMLVLLVIYLRRVRQLTQTKELLENVDLQTTSTFLVDVALRPPSPIVLFSKHLLLFSAISLVILSIILVALWTKDPVRAKDFGYLGTPHWENDSIIVWHIVIMAGGFFTAQVCIVRR